MDHRRRHLSYARIFKHYSNIIIASMIKELENELEKAKRRPMKRKRSLQGDDTVAVLKEPPIKTTNLLRMTPDLFELLLSKVSPLIQRTDTNMRNAIPARVKLESTLTFLVTGNSYKTLSNMYKVSKSAISLYIPEVLDALYESTNDFVKTPATHEEWKSIERLFNIKWSFPGVYGAIGGKRVSIRTPPCDYSDHKGTNSIVVLAVVDDDYCFRYISIEPNDGAFENSPISHNLKQDMLPNGGFFVGDSSFPLETYLMRPYEREPILTSEQKVFNCRIARILRLFENAFGILVSRFKIFEQCIGTDVSVTEKIIRTACALHNWLRKTSTAYLTGECVDFEDVDSGEVVPGSWRRQSLVLLSDVDQKGSGRSSLSARKLRDKLALCFVNE